MTLRSVFGVPSWWRRPAVLGAGLGAVVLVATGLAAPAAVAVASPAEPAAETATTASTTPLTAPDQTTAQAIARLEGREVEVMGERTETSSVFALPDGSFASGQGTGPAWVRRGGDGTQEKDWAAVDLTLQRGGDGVVRPVAQSGDLQLSGGDEPDAAGGSVMLASVTDPESGTVSQVAWEGSLPEPTLQGRRATYGGVRPGIDLVVEATATGFQEFFVVKERPSEGQPLDLPLTVRTEGADSRVEQTDDGGLQVVVGDQVQAVAPGPLMWDATADAGRAFPVTEDRPAEDASAPRLAPMPDSMRTRSKAKASAEVRGQARDKPNVTGDVEVFSGGQTVDVEHDTQLTDEGDGLVTLTPQEDFLQDPSTVYPVVVDPELTLNMGFDTYVLNTSSTSRFQDTELAIGTWDGQAHVARTFISFPTAGFAGKHVVGAELQLFNYYSYSCQSRSWRVHDTGAADPSTVWANQPGWGNQWATSFDTHGYSGSCPGGWSVAVVTSLAAQWAAQGATQGNVGIAASDEADSYGWKRFIAAEYGAYIPTLWVNYNTGPNIPTGLSVPTAPGASATWVNTRTPTLSETVSDPDGNNLWANFRVQRHGTGEAISVWGAGWVPSGSAVSVVSPQLDEGLMFDAHSSAYDGVDTSPVTPWLTFGVDTIKPLSPYVTSTDYPDDAVGHKGPGQAGTFTFSMAPADGSVTGYRWGLDKAPDPAQTVGVTAGAAGTVAITPPTAGRHELNVQSIDRAGNLSAQITTYAFRVGQAGILAPKNGSRVVRRTRIMVDSTISGAKVQFQWRRGPDSPDTTIQTVPPAFLSTSTGTGWTQEWQDLPTGANGYTTWDVGGTLGFTGGPVQVRARVSTNPANAAIVETQWVTITVDPDSDGSASTDVGPGSVNVLTGDYTLSGTDGNEFGLSLNRTASSRTPASGYQLQSELLTAAQRAANSTTGFTGFSTVIATATDRSHAGSSDGTSLKVTASGTSADSFVSLGGDAGSMRLGLVAGRTYRFSGWVYVPSTGASVPTPGSGCGLRIALFWKVSTSTKYSTPCAAGGASSPTATVANGWQQLTFDATVPAGATEAFVRLYNGFTSASGQVVYFDDLSVRELWSPLGPQWSLGMADDAAGTDYVRITRPYDEVAAVQLSGGGDLWFTTGNGGASWWPEPGGEALTLTRDATADTWTITELDGTVTTFTKTAGTDTYGVSTTAPPVAAGATRFVYETAGSITRLKRMVAPVEPGVDGQACASDAPVPGCEVLELEYATTTSATDGTFAGQLATVWARAFDPATNAMAKVAVVSYGYDSTGRLTSVWDPRVSPALKTTYAYDSSGRVTNVTGAGEPGYTMTYGAGGASATTGSGDWIDPSLGRLLSVARPSGVAGQTNTTSVVYQVPLTTTAGGPYDLSATALASWAQVDGPTDATAVFDPSTPVTVNTATSSNPGASGYKTATVHYLNASGLEVNTASPVGANAPAAGYIDTTEYDWHGNPIRTLDATNRLVALGQLDGTSLASWGLSGQPSASLAQLLDSRTTYSEDGLDVLVTLGPVQKLAVANNPNDQRLLRARVVNTYDENKPGGARFHLVTTSVSDAYDPGTNTGGIDPITTTYGYEPPAGVTDRVAPSSGWVHKQPSRVTVDATGANPVTSTVVYDDRARALRSSKPGSNGSDSATTVSTYYTAGANAEVAACGNKPQWAGQPCQTTAAGAVTGHDGANAAGALPVKQVTGYNMWGSPTVVTESATGPVAGATVTDTRTTTTVYDGADRVTSVEITGTGTGAGAAVARTTTVYDPGTGEVTEVRSVDGAGTVTSKIVKAYDAFGRLTSYTDATGATTTTTYDRYGRPTRESQTIAGTTVTSDFAYDDPRGYVTSFTDSVAGTISATWGPDGQLTKESLPGGIDLVIGYDPARVPVSRTYQRASDQQVIFTDQVVENHKGQWLKHASTTAVMTYAYDAVGRLTAVTDTASGGACTARAYAYDVRSNRTGFASATAASNGAACPTATAAAWGTYDSADRLVSAAGQGGWVYDPFGRTTSMVTSTGQVTNEYYVNDLVAAQTITGSQKYTWSLDPVGRRTTNVQKTWTNGAWVDAVTKVSHYSTDSDEPSWIAEDASLPSAVTRYVSGVEGDIAVTTSTTGGRVVQLVDLHGDVVGTVPIADGSSTATWSGLVLQRTDEFGNPEPLTGAGATTGPPSRYGWLGAAQRSAEALGQVVLMGVRLYSSVTGRFLQPDPVPGGSANAYDYCTGDPVNCTDLAGTRINWGKVLKVVAVVGEIASLVPGPIGAAAGAVSAVAYAATGNKAKALEMGVIAAAALVGAGAVVATAVRVGRVVKAANAFHEGVAGARGSIRASRPIAAIAGRVWVGRGATSGIAKNGARMLTQAKGGPLVRSFRSAAKKGKLGWSSNLDQGIKGTSAGGKSLYSSFHVSHRSRWW